MVGKVKVGIIGSQFEADIHAASFRIMPEEAEVVAVASPTPGHPEALAAGYGIPCGKSGDTIWFSSRSRVTVLRYVAGKYSSRDLYGVPGC